MIDYLDRAQMDTSDEDTDKGESNEESLEEEEEEEATGAEPAHATEEVAAPMEYYGQIEAAAAAGGAPKFKGGRRSWGAWQESRHEGEVSSD